MGRADCPAKTAPQSSEDQKRSEKLLKKAKPFLDDKQKPKTRLASLQAYINAANQLEQATFFRQHSDLVFSVVWDGFKAQTEKIRQRPEKLTLNSTEFAALRGYLSILRKSLLYLSDRYREGWQTKNIVCILATLLDHRNQHRLRMEGFHLLLLWLNDWAVASAGTTQSGANFRIDLVPQELLNLYANAVRLDVFLNSNAEKRLDTDAKIKSRPRSETVNPAHVISAEEDLWKDGAQVKLYQQPIRAESPKPLLPSTTPWTPSHSVDMIVSLLANIIRLAYVAAGSPAPTRPEDLMPEAFASNGTLSRSLGNLQDGTQIGSVEYFGEREFSEELVPVGTGIDAATSAVRFMIELFERKYAVKLFPQVCRRLGLLGGVDNDYGFHTCPPPVLEMLMFFVGRFLVDTNGVPFGFAADRARTSLSSSAAGTYRSARSARFSPSTSKFALEQQQPQASSAAAVSPPVAVSPANPILMTVMLGKRENRELTHEIVRQCLLLPFAWADTVRLAVHILGVWMLAPDGDRPSFLRGILSVPKKRLQHSRQDLTGQSLRPSADASGVPDTDADSSDSLAVAGRSQGIPLEGTNGHFYQYIDFLKLVFDRRPVDGNGLTFSGTAEDGQVSAYMDVLYLFRAIVVDKSFRADKSMWEKMLVSLLYINERLMNCTPASSMIAGTDQAIKVSSAAVETLIYACIRSRTANGSLWLKLQEFMIKSTQWSASVTEWTKCMLVLTETVAKEVFGVSVSLDNGTCTAVRSDVPRAAVSALAPAPRQPSDSRDQPPLREAGGDKSTSEKPVPAATLPAGISALSTATDAQPGSKAANDEALHQAAASSDRPRSLSRSLSWPNERLSGLLTVPGENKEVSVHITLDSMKLTNSYSSKCAADFAKLSLPQDSERMLSIWHSMACLLGNPNEIADPVINEAALRCLVDVWDMLAAVRDAQPFDNVEIPPLLEFIPWMLQAADRASEFNGGRSVAFAGLCRMMCRVHDQSLPTEYYSLFYQAVLKGLASSETKIICPIVSNCTKLFTMGLPGCNMLIPAFVNAIDTVILTKPRRGVEIAESVRQSALSLLASIVCICTKLKAVTAPKTAFNALRLKPHTWAKFEAEEEDVQFRQVRKQAKDAVLRALAADSSSKPGEGMRRRLLCCISVVAFDELLSASPPDNEIVRSCLDVVLDQLYSVDYQLVSASTDCLELFSQDVSILGSFNENLLSNVLETLIGAVDLQLNPYNDVLIGVRCQIVSRLLLCISNWLIIMPSKQLVNSERAMRLFEALDKVLKFAKSREEASTPGAETTVLSKSFKGSYKSTASETPLASKSGRPNSTGNEIHIPPEGDFACAKEAAVSVLCHALHHYNNYPPPYGAALLHSAAVDPMMQEGRQGVPEKELHFVHCGTTIITLVEMPSIAGEDPRAHVIVRNEAGKFAWDCRLFYSASLDAIKSADAIPSAAKADFQETRFCFPATNDAPEGERPIPDHEREDQAPARAPLWDPQEKPENVDRLLLLLRYIGSTYPDCRRQDASALDTPAAVPAEHAEKVIQISLELERHMTEELAAAVIGNDEMNVSYDGPLAAIDRLTSAIERSSQYESEALRQPLSRVPLLNRTRRPFQKALVEELTSANTHVAVLENRPVDAPWPYQRCQMLLTHFGLMGIDPVKDESLVLLEKSAALARDIKGLDRRTGRETVKVAVIYVASGQEDEVSILRNAAGSKMYEDFVTSLGWEIDTSKHPGYLGGLERNQTNGATAIYHCTSTTEIIFHDTTRLPTDPDDPRQMKKKRHIGNDQVHIVWNEHARPYKKNTFTGDFGNAVIVVTPLPDLDMFAIDVLRDPNVPLFGPLLDKMVVARPTLGTLARMTALHAYRATVYAGGTPIKHPFAYRAADIQTILRRHRGSQCSYQNFISHIFSLAEVTSHT